MNRLKVTYTRAKFSDRNGKEALVQDTEFWYFLVTVFESGKQIFRRKYKTWHGARKALNRFDLFQYEIKDRGCW